MSPGRLDPAVVRRHLFSIDDAVRNLRRHQGGTADLLATNRDELWSIERGLQLCAQNVLDIATHIAASAGREVPDYGSAIDRLGEMGILPGQFAARLRAIAGFRNVIVHGYLEVDLRMVHALLNERLEDFTEFARLVDQYLRALPAD
jgi:uncharacterized protein YutE (UPF0331/DUF86 family)